MEPEKPKFNWQRMLITTGIVLVATLVIGGTTWYVMDKSAKEIKTANDKSVSELQKQIDELGKRVSSNSNNNSSAANVNPQSGLKTYINSSPIFSFKYPTNLVATKDEGANGAVWLSTDGLRANTTLQIVYEPSKNIDPKLYFEALVAAGAIPQPYTIEGYGTIGTYRVYQVDYSHQGQASSVMYLYSNGYTYTISFPGSQQEAYMDILKTFLIS